MTRDPYDELFADLAPRSTSIEDARATFAELTPRYRRARRRHRVKLGLTAGTVVAALAAGTTAVIMSIDDSVSDSVDVTTQVPDDPNGPPVPDGGSQDVAPTVSARADDSVSGDLAEPGDSSETDPSNDLAPDGSNPAADPSSGLADDPSAGDDGVTDDDRGEESGSGSTEDAESPAVEIRRSFDTPGGSATVALTGGVLTLVDHEPAPGFAEEIRGDGTPEIEVKFEQNETEYKIKFEIHDGAITVDLEPDSDHENETESDSGYESP